MRDMKKLSQKCWCPWCEQESVAKVADNGIGPYEYWGVKGVHVHYEIVTECCEEPAMHLNDYNRELEIDDLVDEYGY